MAPEASKKELDTLEEDDEFEEFGNEEWDQAEEDSEDVQQWEDDWDDDDVTDDFAKQLRAEIDKAGPTKPMQQG